MRLPSSDSFSSRFLGQVLQLRLVKYPLKLLQKASIWIGLGFPVEILRSKLCPPAQSPTRPGKLVHLLLSVTPTRIQNFLGYLLTEWGQSNISKETQEALMDPARERDDEAPKEQDTWLVFLERDLPEDDSDDFTYEPSELESDSEEYQAQNDTDLELEELGEVQEALAIQGPVPLELGAEDPTVASGDAQNPRANRCSREGSEQEDDTSCDTSTSQDGENWEP